MPQGIIHLVGFSVPLITAMVPQASPTFPPSHSYVIPYMANH